jgi:hypothetical protein
MENQELQEAIPLLQIESSAKKQGMDSFATTERIVDLRKIAKTEKKMVTLYPIKQRDAHKEPRVSFMSFTDEEGLTWGIPLKVNEKNGRIIFKRLTIDGSFTFNLERMEEAMQFELWKRSPFVKGGLISGSQRPVLYIKDEIKEAEDNVKRAKIRNSNEAFLLDAATEDIRNLAIVIIGQEAIKNNPTVNRNELLKYNVEKPEILKRHIDNSASIDVLSTFEKAFAYGLIVLDPVRGFVTDRGGLLGLDKQQAINRFRSSVELYRNYEDRIKMMEGSGKAQFMTSDKLAPTPEARLQKAIQDAQDPESLMIHPSLGGKETAIEALHTPIDQGVDIINAGNPSATFMPTAGVGESNIFDEDSSNIYAENDFLKEPQPTKPAGKKKGKQNQE